MHALRLLLSNLRVENAFGVSFRVAPSSQAERDCLFFFDFGYSATGDECISEDESLSHGWRVGRGRGGRGRGRGRRACDDEREKGNESGGDGDH